MATHRIDEHSWHTRDTLLPSLSQPEHHTASTVASHLWGIVLAGGDGKRLQSFIRAHLGDERPKQYCTFIGTCSLLRQTLHRAERLIPSERLLTVITRAYLPYAQVELADRPPHTTIVQPSNRDTGPGILLPLLHVLCRDPDAIVALFPSDHFIVHEERLMAAVAAAAAWVTQTPARVVLLGVSPIRPEVEYGWIALGEILGQAQGQGLYQVRRFWEKPSLAQARGLLAQGALWNTFILVGRARTVLALYQLLTPALVAEFGYVRSQLGSPEESDLLDEVYTHLPAVNFSQAILVPSAPRLAVLPVQGVYWSDWGNAQRLQRDLARFGSTAAGATGSPA